MINLEIYSPEEEIQHPVFIEKDIQVYLKRDDLIHPFISGNKWRKLKYHLLEAESLNKKHLITFGGVWSNHLLATACAGAKFGFKTTGFVRGEDITSDVLFLCRQFGMNLQFVDRESYKDKTSLFNSLAQDDNEAYFIDEGGHGPLGTKGCSELVQELNQSYDHIFCACGTGTTAAGIINGLTNTNSSTIFNAIPVLKGDFLRTSIKDLLLKQVEFEYHDSYNFGGYAKTNPQLLSFISDFTAATGILIDPVYTGKLMFAILDLAKSDYFLPQTKILAIHTGGLFGLLGMKDKFAKL